MSDHIVPPRTYVVSYLILVTMTLVTAGVAFLDLGLFNPVAALTIAVFKALVVVLFFMHARYSPKLIWIVGGAAVFWLGILLALTLSDYLTRGWAYY
jgi:cytochrome c oxidase subunit IV